MTYVPFPGTAPAVNALLGDHVTAAVAEYPVVVEHIKSGQLRALAVATPARIETFPEIPTVAESGYPNYEIALWYSLFAPAKTRRDAVSQLADRFAAAMQVPQLRSKLALQGLFPAGLCGGEFATYLHKQFDAYKEVIRKANIKGE
jgi:tripartite-type tricarboxylate transporter receptor subunit TctC